jgi:hypothetical protein
MLHVGRVRSVFLLDSVRSSEISLIERSTWTHGGPGKETSELAMRLGWLHRTTDMLYSKGAGQPVV